MGEGTAAGTRSALRTALGHWEAFTRAHSHRPAVLIPRYMGDLQASLHNEYTMVLFAAFLSRPRVGGASLQANTILAYCSHVRSHIATHLGVPIATDTTRWRRMAKGVKRHLHEERAKCRGLRAQHLNSAAAVFFAARGGQLQKLNQWACAALGRASLARPHELCALRRRDVTFETSPKPHAVVRLQPLKKAPGTDRVPVLIAKGDASGADAYTAICRLMFLDPADGTAFLLRRADPQRTPFTKEDVTAAVRAIAAAANETNILQFSGRSLRIGGATDLHAAGVDPLTIQLAGRWAGDAYRAYTRATTGSMLRMSHALQSAPSDPALEDGRADYTQSTY